MFLLIIKGKGIKKPRRGGAIWEFAYLVFFAGAFLAGAFAGVDGFDACFGGGASSVFLIFNRFAFVGSISNPWLVKVKAVALSFFTLK